MPKVEFMSAYKNGQFGLDVRAGEIVELSNLILEQVSQDMRNPHDQLKILGGKKSKAEAAAEAANDEG